MAKPSSSETPSLIFESPTIQIKNMSEEALRGTIEMLNGLTGSGQIPDDCNTKSFYSDISRGHLRQLRIERGRVTYLLSVKPAVSNAYGFLHGGFVAAAAEFLSIACARTVVGEDKELFIGELSISYLSGAPGNGSAVSNFCVLNHTWAGGLHVTESISDNVLQIGRGSSMLYEIGYSREDTNLKAKMHGEEKRFSDGINAAEVVIDASVLRSGRSLSVVAVEFRLQKTGKLVYTARSTLYNMPMAKL